MRVTGSCGAAVAPFASVVHTKHDVGRQKGLQMVAQRYTDPTIASLLMSLESVFAVIAGALLLGERMTARELAGCVIMFAAIVLVQIPLPERRR